jgi:galactokinase
MRYVDAVVDVVRPAAAGRGQVTTTLPIGAGLSSSAALEVAVALAVGFKGSSLELARACQEAEHRASGVPCGIMDQLVSAAGVEGHGLLIDCSLLAVTPVPIPKDADVVVIHSGQSRALAGSAYAERRAQCERAADEIGPLRDASLPDVEGIADPVVRARARHVVTENQRVLDFAAALEVGDLVAAGRLMIASHTSLRDDFEVSSPAVNDVFARVRHLRDVFGVRITGAGFGGCLVALTRPGALDKFDAPAAWRVAASRGAYVESSPK